MRFEKREGSWKGAFGRSSDFVRTAKISVRKFGSSSTLWIYFPALVADITEWQFFFRQRPAASFFHAKTCVRVNTHVTIDCTSPPCLRKLRVLCPKLFTAFSANHYYTSTLYRSFRANDGFLSTCFFV